VEFGLGNVNSVLPENIEQHLKDGYKLIDVREEHEWNAGHHPEAVHIPMGNIPESMDNFKEETKYVIICRSGHRSGKVAAYLDSQGYECFNMIGGMKQFSVISDNVHDSSGKKGNII